MCGEKIALQRLMTRPLTNYCIKCKEAPKQLKRIGLLCTGNNAESTGKVSISSATRGGVTASVICHIVPGAKA